MMKIEYDPEADAAYIYLKFPLAKGECKKTVEISPNINVDYDATGKIVGIEILNAKKILNKNVIEAAVTI